MPTYATVADFGAYSSRNGGYNGYTRRTVISAASLAINATKIRLTLKAHPTENYTIGMAYFGHQAASGDAYDFDGGQVKITFDSGSDSTTVLAGVDKYSDEINFTLDETKNAVWAVYCTSAYDSVMAVGGTISSHYKSGNDTATTDATGYSAAGTAAIMWLTKIESVTDTVTGTGTSTAQAAASAGAGDVLNPVTGTGASTAQAAASAGAGDVLNPVTGTGAATAQAASSSGEGTITEVVTGTGAATAQAATASGSGTAVMVVYGVGAAVAAAASSLGSGVVSGQFPIFVNPSYGSKEVTVREQLQSPAEAGYTIARAKFTRARRRYQLVWDFLSEEDYETLRTFFAVNQGCNFKWIHPVSAEVITCQFMDSEFEGEFKSYGQRSCTLNIGEV